MDRACIGAQWGAMGFMEAQLSTKESKNLTIIFNSLLAYLGTKEKRNHSYYDQGKKERKKKPRN